MDLYEYQARQLLEEQDIPTPDAIFAQNSHEVAEAADKIGYPCVIKAQVKIGHRGQAGGVKIAHNRDEAILESESILPMTIHGHKVSGVLVAEAKNILHEYYVSISVDRTSRDFDVLATANGGTEVEEIAKEHPEAAKRLHIDALGDFDLAAATEMAQSIGFYHADVDQAAQILLKMWRCFKDNDATLVEINPLAKIGDPDDESTKQLSALDAKISLDDNASFRHDGWARFVDPIVPDPFEQRAREHGLHYVHLHGEVGVIGNGAGLVMSSLDAVSGAGEEQGTNIKPANFLDIGGGASIMGTLSGGGKLRNSIGEHSLLGANAGIGISLGDDCVVEAGLYVTAGTKVTIYDKAKVAAGEPLETVKGADLSGKDNILFIRNSVSGRIEARYRKTGIELNEKLHKN